MCSAQEPKDHNIQVGLQSQAYVIETWSIDTRQHLVGGGFTQVYGISYEGDIRTHSPARILRILDAFVTRYGLEVEQNGCPVCVSKEQP